MKKTPPRHLKTSPAKPREKVLIVAHSNGLVETFAESNVDVVFVNRLHVDGDESANEANLIDLFLESQIPKPYRSLYIPGKCRCEGFHDKITAKQALSALCERSILKGIRDTEREKAKAKVPAVIAKARRVKR